MSLLVGTKLAPPAERPRWHDRSGERPRCGMSDPLVQHDGEAIDLVAMIAHDLRNPVTAIKGLSQLALRQPELPPPTRLCLERVLVEANYVAALLEQLVLLHAVEHGSPPVPRPTRIDGLITSAIEQVARLGVKTIWHPPARSSTRVVQCDPSITGSALAMLIGWIARSADGSPVEIIARSGRETMTIALTPRGLPAVGRTASARPARGQESEGTPSRHTGGLELFIGRRLIQIQGGAVRSEAIAGTRVRLAVTLPGGRAAGRDG